MSNPKLHQILAVERDRRQTSKRRVTDAYQQLQRPALLAGIARSYQPKNDEGDQLPSESTKVQVRAQQALVEARAEFIALWDVVATKDFGNTIASADIVVDGTTLVENAPVTYLLWLEKELTDLHTLVSKLPTLDSAEEWEFSEEQDCYATEPVQTHRTKKVPRLLTKAPATDKHAAQVDVWQEDVVDGYWTTIKYSGALPATTVREMLDRVNALRDAVKIARANANETEIEQKKVASSMLDYVFQPLTRSQG